MPIEVRQDSASGVCYIRIWGKQYRDLDKKIHKLTVKINRASGKNKAEADRMNRMRAQLMQERRKAEQYVKVSERDLPEGMHIRPIYKLSGQVVQVTPEEYAVLIGKLQETGAEQDEQL